MAAAVVALEPVATTVASAWDFCFFVFCQLSDVGKGRLNSEKTRVCLVYCVDVCHLKVLPR